MEALKDLKAEWAALQKKTPKIRIRNAATILGVSEVELLATKCGAEVTRLKPEFSSILLEVEALGRVMALTRNHGVVHERKGIYQNPSLDNPHVGLFVGADIDLRLFFQSWKSCFAVTEQAGDTVRRSLQFFAMDGEAIHKIYMLPTSDHVHYETLVKKYRNENQFPVEPVSPVSDPDPEKADELIDVTAFRMAWTNLKDTHHFFGLLKKFGLTRTQALRLAPTGNFAVKVDHLAMRKVLDLAAENKVEVMVFVGNKGMIQIHTGPVKKLLEHGDWYNVMDPAFNLHVLETVISDTWIVRKPTEDGVVTALECFDKEGQQLVQFFGKRKPGIPELQAWRKLMDKVETAHALKDA